MHLKLFQTKKFKKQKEQLAISLVIKPLIKLQKFKKLHNRIFQNSEIQNTNTNKLDKEIPKERYLQKNKRKS